MYKMVNGVNLYYEILNEEKKDPIIFLHGNQESSVIFRDYVSHFPKNKILLVDSRCHGNSKGNKDTLSYEQMADDIYCLLQTLNIKKIDVIGFSDGAIIALILAKKHIIVGKLFLLGINFMFSDFTLITRAEIYLNYLFYFRKKAFYRLMVKEPNIKSKVTLFADRIILIFGENDVIKKKKQLDIHKKIKNSELIVIPKANHYLIQNNCRELINILEDYYEGVI